MKTVHLGKNSICDNCSAARVPSNYFLTLQSKYQKNDNTKM